MHLMMQPILLRELLADPLAQGQGLIARCLIAEPTSLAGSRFITDEALPEAIALEQFHRAAKALLEKSPTVVDFSDGYELAPRALQLTPQASALWTEFYNEVERQQADGCELAGVRAFASKAAEQAARMAGVIQVIGNPEAVHVDEYAMAGGIELAGFFLGEHVRLCGHSIEGQRLRQLRTLLGWMQDRGPWVRNNDVLQYSPRIVRSLKAKGLAILLDELTERGYIRALGDKWEVRDV